MSAERSWAARGAPGKVRVDAWCWAVRMFSTRTAAATACRAGHVRVNGDRAKPATLVSLGDEVRVRGTVDRVVVVRQLLVKRVSATLAAQALDDHTPSPPPKAEIVAGVAVRDRGAGRPTKRERREIDRFRGR